MRTMKNAVEELVIEMDAHWAEETGDYALAEVAAEPSQLALWAGIERGTDMAHLMEAAPSSWQKVKGKDGANVWFRGVPQLDGPAMVVQVSRVAPEAEAQRVAEIAELEAMWQR